MVGIAGICSGVLDSDANFMISMASLFSGSLEFHSINIEFQMAVLVMCSHVLPSYCS